MSVSGAPYFSVWAASLPNGSGPNPELLIDGDSAVYGMHRQKKRLYQSPWARWGPGLRLDRLVVPVLVPARVRYFTKVTLH